MKRAWSSILIGFAALTTTAGATSQTPGALAEQTDGHAPSLLERPALLELRGVSLTGALTRLSQASGVPVAFSPSLVTAEPHRVACQCRELTVRQALERILESTTFGYRELHGEILVYRKADSLPPPTLSPAQRASLRWASLTALLPSEAGGPARHAVADTVVAGVVVNATTGEPLQGVQVSVVGTQRGTLTDPQGRFRIEAGGGDVSLRLQRIGFRTTTVEVAAGEREVRVALEESAVLLDQLVVTGTLVPTEVRAIPTPITVVTAEDIERRNIRRIDEIFRGLVPGAVSTDNGAGSYSTTVYVRGTTSLFSGVSSVKTYVDGVEVTQHNFLAGLNPEIIERVEMIRGPQAATIYGPEAINGVVQIFTKKGRIGAGPELRAKAVLGGIESPYTSGPSLTHDHHVDLSGGGDGFSYHLGAGYQETGEWQPEHLSRTPSFNAGGRIGQGPVTVDLSTRYSWTAHHFAWNPILRDAGFAPWSRPPMERLALDQQTHAVQVRYAPTSAWEHRLLIGQDLQSFNTHQTGARLSTPADTLLRVQAGTNGRLTLSYSSTLGVPLGGRTRSTLTTGVDHHRLEGSGFDQSNTSRVRGALDGINTSSTRTSSSNSGAFAQAVVDLGHAVHVTAGLRADRSENFGEDFGTAISPRVGAAYTREVKGVSAKLRVAYGQAIRPPGQGAADEIVTPSFRRLPNPGLAPERQRGWDAGVDLFFGRQGKLAVTRYDQTVVDLIETVLVDATAQPLLYQAQNVSRIANSGWELEAASTLGPLSIVASATMMNSKVVELAPSYGGTQELGKQLGGVPVYSGGMELTLALDSRTRVSGNLSHRGSWRELDLFAYYSWIFGGDEYRGSLAAYLMDYDPVTRIDLSFARELSASLSGFVQVQNVANHSRPERSNVQPVTGRMTGLGIRVKR